MFQNDPTKAEVECAVKSKEYSNLIGKMEEEEEPLDGSDRRKHTQESLRKLTSSSTNPDASSIPQSPARSPSLASPPIQSRSHSMPTETKKAEMSLAEFMGGRATGPRLNKHAPQQDAHDPTQFLQRTHISAPHPVFGKGGVAMPGMAAKGKVSTSNISSSNQRSEEAGQSFSPFSRVSDTSVTPTVVEPSISPSVVPPQETGRRERTTSTPAGSSSYRDTTNADSQEVIRNLDRSRRPASRSSIPSTPTKPYSVRSKTPETRPKTPDTRPKTPQGRANGTAIPSTSSASAVAPPPVMHRQQSLPFGSTTPRKSPITTPSLARPIRPDPRPSPQGPQIPLSQNPSPAFLRTTSQKDPTPSLSRLQGRGFVQSMVKVSSQIENMSTGSVPRSGFSPSNEKTRPTTPRKSSVLERWPAASLNNAVSPPVSPNYPSASGTRTSIVPPVSPAPPSVYPKPQKPVETTKPLKTSSSFPSIPSTEGNAPARQPLKRKSITNIMPPEGTPGLGSASTLISYVKTTKTGDDPTPSLAPEPSADVDELGVRTSNVGAMHERSARKPVTASELPAPSGKPLSHVRSFW
jgi:hypothetical protein